MMISKENSPVDKILPGERTERGESLGPYYQIVNVVLFSCVVAMHLTVARTHTFNMVACVVSKTTS